MGGKMIFSYIGSGLIILGYLGYLLVYLINKGKIISKDNGFNISKETLLENDTINVIEVKKLISYYDIKRRVIKLDTKTYYGMDASSLMIVLNEVATSVIHDKKNKFINIVSKIFNNLKILAIFPILVVVINLFTYGKVDSEFGILITGLSLIIMYFLIDLRINGFNFISNKINKLKEITKEGKKIIQNEFSKIIFIDKMIFFGELIILVRYVLILFEISF